MYAYDFTKIKVHNTENIDVKTLMAKYNEGQIHHNEIYRSFCAYKIHFLEKYVYINSSFRAFQIP